MILVELEEQYRYSKKDLPSIDAINRFLRQESLVKQRAPSGQLAVEKCKPAKRFHDLWEMDAQGAVAVRDLGYVSMINIKDFKSKVHCVAFPVHVKGIKSQPKTLSYLWSLRLAFEQRGLPKAIQVDKDSVFIDNTSKSPFPSKVHLFLIALGVKLCFINVAPPLKQATVERSHQTMDRHALKGQQYKYWKELFLATALYTRRVNEKLPSRLLDKKAPLEKFPKAKHSGRAYNLQQEEELMDIKRVHKYLAKCSWYRRVSNARSISISGKIYYVRQAKPMQQIKINFCNRSKKLVFRNVNEHILAKVPPKNLTIKAIMGGTSKELIQMRKKLFRARDFPL